MSDIDNQQAADVADDWVVVGEEVAAPVESAAQDETQEAEAVTEESTDDLIIADDEESPTSEEDEDDVEVPEDAPNWAKQLRQRQKELARENKALKQAQAQAAAPAYQPESFTEKEPELEDDGIDYDAAKFKAKYQEWTQKKAAFEAKQSEQRAEYEQLQSRFNERLADYSVKKTEISQRFKDYDDAEKVVISEVPQAVQNAILLYAEKPELIVLAAGRNKELRDKLAKLQSDPVALGIEIGRLNKAVKLGDKPKPKVEPTPQVKAPAGKPPSPEDARFRQLFPDAKFS